MLRVFSVEALIWVDLFYPFHTCIRCFSGKCYHIGPDLVLLGCSPPEVTIGESLHI